MTSFAYEQPFIPDWPEPAPRFLREERPAPPQLPLIEVFGVKWAEWIARAAEAKSSPPDYIVAGLLAAAGSAIGNSRWSSPWQGWAEPPILWTMAIGSPSSNKSPGLDAILSPLKQAERVQRQEVEASLMAWREGLEVAKVAESAWKEEIKAALKQGGEAPPRPDAANPGSEPFLPRLGWSGVGRTGLRGCCYPQIIFNCFNRATLSSVTMRGNQWGKVAIKN